MTVILANISRLYHTKGRGGETGLRHWTTASHQSAAVAARERRETGAAEEPLLPGSGRTINEPN